MVNQFLHLHQNRRFFRRQIFWVLHRDRTFGQFLNRLTQDFDALTHLFESNQVTIVGIANRPDRDIEIVVLVVEVRLGFSDVVLNAAAANVRTGQTIRDSVFLGDHARDL